LKLLTSLLLSFALRASFAARHLASPSFVWLHLTPFPVSPRGEKLVLLPPWGKVGKGVICNWMTIEWPLN